MWNFFGALASGLLGFGSNIMTNNYNKKLQDEANKTNIQIARETNQANRDMTAATNLANRELVREQNAAAAAEAEKAYQRSKPTTQVGNMQAAGMSLAGAINSLNGGGSYSPAPVNTARDEASRDNPAQVSPAQMMSAEGVFSNIAQAFAQRAEQKHAEKMAKMQIAAQKEENAASRENAKEIAQISAEASKYGADTSAGASKYSADKAYEIALKRYNLDKDVAERLTPKQVEHLDSIIAKNKAEADLTSKQASDLAYRIAEYQSEEYKSVRTAQNLLAGLQADFDYKITNKSFNDYLNENYDYNEETGEYTPKKWISNANKVQQGARAVWSTIFEILPVNLLLESLGGTVENVRAIKLLSKVK